MNLDDCCSISYEISVKKCDTVKYVYQLANPEACDMAYCAGSGAPCEAGKVWVEENNKCEGQFLCRHSAAWAFRVNNFSSKTTRPRDMLFFF